MKEHPILFKPEMVRAILAGRKTQTRRILDPQPDDLVEGQTPRQLRVSIGDRLWVREMWTEYEAIRHPDPRRNVLYRADLPDSEPPATDPPTAERLLWLTAPKRWRPGIHMPREFCRLILTVMDVRVQRLQDISEADAMAEGSPPPGPEHFPGICRREFRNIWIWINGQASWDANPWVAAYTFTHETVVGASS